MAMGMEPCSGGNGRRTTNVIFVAQTCVELAAVGVEPDIVVEEGKRDQERDVFMWSFSLPLESWSGSESVDGGDGDGGLPILWCTWRRLVEGAMSSAKVLVRKQCSL